MKPIVIDGSFGEGGGQILRSSLTLSMITQTPIEIHSIRAGRKVSGLRKQHLTCVRAAGEICGAEITGDHLGSSGITFTPGRIQAGSYRFATGSAGSAFLVFQTLFPALMIQNEPSHLTLQGGTHNHMAPPAEFLERSFLGTLRRAGAHSSLKLNRYGYYPVGGGEVEVAIDPAKLTPLYIDGISPVEKISGETVIIRKSKTVAEIQEQELKNVIPDILVVQLTPPSVGPGNSVTVTVHRNEIEQVFTGFGKKNTPPLITARVAAKKALAYINAGVFCDAHLTDQLMIPLVLAGGGSFTCPKPTLHATTNAEIISIFTGVEVRFEQQSDTVWNCVIPENSLID